MIRNKLAIAMAASVVASTISAADAGVRLRLDANKLFGIDHELLSAVYFPGEHKLVLKSQSSQDATPLVCGYENNGEIEPVAVSPDSLSGGAVYLELDGKAYRLEALPDSGDYVRYTSEGEDNSRVVKLRPADIDYQNNQTLVCGESGSTNLSLRFGDGAYGPSVPLGSGFSYSSGDTAASFDLLDPFICADFAPQASGVGLDLTWREPLVEDASGNFNDVVYRERTASSGLSGPLSGIEISGGGQVSVHTSDSLECHTIARSQSFYNYGRQEFIFRDGFGDGFNDTGLQIEMESADINEPLAGGPIPTIAPGSSLTFRVIANSLQGMAQNVAMNSRVLVCDAPNDVSGRCQTLEAALAGSNANYESVVSWEGPGTNGDTALPPVRLPATQAVTLGNSNRSVVWDVTIDVPAGVGLEGKELRFAAAIFSDASAADSNPSDNRAVAGFEVGNSP